MILKNYVKIKGGKRLPKGEMLTSIRTKHPYIKVKNMLPSKLEINEAFEYVKDTTFEKIKRYTVKQGDVILSIVGTIGNVSFIGETLNNASLTENCIKLIPTDNILSKYLFYFLLSDNGKVQILNGIVGTTQPKLPMYNIEQIEFNPPTLDKQQHIVNTIGSVDDLIENYEKQLETIYNLLKVSLSNYSEKVSISYYNPEIIKSSVKKFTDKKKYIDTSAINGINNINTTSQITYNKRPSRANMQPTPNSCWFAKMKGSYKFLVLSYLDNDIISSCILSTGFLGIKANSKLPLSFLTAIMISDSFIIQRNLNSVGTTMSGVNNQTFKKILVPKLTEEEIEQYDNKYKCLIYRMSYLRKQINFLLTIKQTLLSKYF